MFLGMVIVLALLFSFSAPAAAADKVKAAYVAIMNFAPLYLAIERGFMKEQNIEVEMQKVASGTEAMAFLAQGSLDA
jgi:NitT/TauT family transport system substrate-binding protein